MQETPPLPPPRQPPLRPVVNRQRSRKQKILALATLAVILFIALLLFFSQMQINEPLEDATKVPERVVVNETGNTAARTGGSEETFGGSAPVASGFSETQKLPFDIGSANVSQHATENMRQANHGGVETSSQRESVAEPNQIKEPASQSGELKNEQDLSKFMPTTDEMANANRLLDAGSKAEFFGICTPCKHVAFLIDSSGSMSGPRFDRVREELLKSLRGLKQSQRFSIYLFKSHTYYKKKNCVVSASEISDIQRALYGLSAYGGTDPTDAIKEAVHDQSDVIFLLSDGKIRQSGEDIARLNRTKKIINTIAIGGDSQSLRDVANKNRGEYRNAQ